MKHFVFIHTAALAEVSAVMAVPAAIVTRLVAANLVFKAPNGRWVSKSLSVDDMIVRVPGSFIERIGKEAR
jgi:hypothetical protein